MSHGQYCYNSSVLKSSPNFCRQFHSSLFNSSHLRISSILQNQWISSVSENQDTWHSTISQFINFVVLHLFHLPKRKKTHVHQILINGKVYVNASYGNLPVQATAENLYESHWKSVSNFFCCLPISSHIQLKLEELLFRFSLLGDVAAAYLLQQWVYFSWR